MNIEDEIKKIKYHIKMISASIGTTDSYASLLVELDWSSEDLSRAQDIFDKYDAIFLKSNTLDGSKLEHELKEEMGINYQDVKLVILTFWANSQWIDICRAYAEQNQCVEFHGILGKTN